jgi:hypothetical protein
MAKKNATATEVEKHSIEGHEVEIRKREGQEELWIDGVRRKFFVNEGGYNLNDAAYERPYKSLLEAVQSYLRKGPKQTERERRR